MKLLDGLSRFGKTALIGAIKLYQRYISPLKRPCCRFYPSCSQYAILAIKKYGVFKGLLKAIWRILRCNPFSDGGIDFP
ncbi:MAG TPA: membrane protein insertion efficiency factor YidD [Firmicutes bacterium]|nr:membrane protein insertion efficiency factor YidD [Bacillota bacterium]